MAKAPSVKKGPATKKGKGDQNLTLAKTPVTVPSPFPSVETIDLQQSWFETGLSQEGRTDPVILVALSRNRERTRLREAESVPDLPSTSGDKDSRLGGKAASLKPKSGTLKEGTKAALPAKSSPSSSDALFRRMARGIFSSPAKAPSKKGTKGGKGEGMDID